jgi:hypothetical protein
MGVSGTIVGLHQAVANGAAAVRLDSGKQPLDAFVESGRSVKAASADETAKGLPRSQVHQETLLRRRKEWSEILEI